MSNMHELLRRKRIDVDKRKSQHTPIIPADDRTVRWNRNEFRIIAEVKRSSLSAGPLRRNLDVVDLAQSYQQAGAAAISVLTEEHYFHGNLQDLQAAAEAVSVPVLQKDFVLDEYQICEAKEAGADFVLLIARFLTSEQLRSFLDLCDSIRMNAIVEVTDRADIDKISGPVAFVGVNARDLETLQVDTSRFERLRNYLPDTWCIAESGITDMETLQRVKELGYHGALIGEHFLRSDDAGQACKEAVHRARTPNVKICGITNERDASLAIEAGASALGFIFADSPRSIAVETLKDFRKKIVDRIRSVGVFRGNSPENIQTIVEQCALDIVQTYDAVRIGVPTWNAKAVSSLAEIQEISGNENLLIDFKLADIELAQAWNSLGSNPVFALAGGLHPQNVRQAISICHPAWVDVARGVERQPGVKDERKLREFVKAVKRQ